MWIYTLNSLITISETQKNTQVFALCDQLLERMRKGGGPPHPLLQQLSGRASGRLSKAI